MKEEIIGKFLFCGFQTTFFAVILGLLFIINGYSQVMYPQNGYMINQPTNNYMANSSAFKQEIARMEIRVVRPGKVPLSITQVPRLEKDDVLKVRLLDEQVNGIKPSDSQFNWTFLVAYINPGRNNDSDKTVSEEINFRKSGWYKEYSFVVPYDSQPIFFMYPKPSYRSKILNLISKNKDDIRKVGEKTIEIADAYAKIGSFLNELQMVVNQNYYRNLYNGYGGNGYYNPTNPYGGMTNNNYRNNQHLLTEQMIERIARSFNIQLPACWTNQFGGGYGGGYYGGGYNNGGMYNGGGYYGGNYGGGYYGGMGGNDFVGRVQCIARNVRIEDFDVSIAQMLQQGGVFAAAQLAQRYPQLSFWINIAAAALDFILKVANKAPMKLVPTIVQSSDNQMTGSNDLAKISLFAENQPNDNGFVTAYPMIFHKWQANSDPPLIDLPMPVMADSCLHAGQNIIRTTDVVNNWMADNFTKDFQLTLSASNGFQKTFPLKKNTGLNGWELNVSAEDLKTIPRINMNLEAEITGKRGFNEIRSPKFDVQLTSGGNWTLNETSRQTFTVGGKRQITLANQAGNCRCLEAVVYKPMFGGQFVFDAKNLTYSADNKEVSFEVDTTGFPAGTGQLELRQFGGETSNVSVNLYPAAPTVATLKIAKGDTQASIIGERIEQVKAIKINGRRAVPRSESGADMMNSQNVSTVMGQQNIPSNGTILKERTFVFEDSSRLQETGNLFLELELDDQRIYRHPSLFGVTAARPTIVAVETKEVEGFVVSDTPQKKLPASMANLPVFPIETSKIAVNIQNALTDYDFKTENLRIETRLENAQNSPIQEGDIDFEVLDWRSMRLNIRLSEQAKKVLGGRRIQFRIVDGKRGNSDWYSIKQTFIRVPNITALKCSAKECEVIGKGISYIQQISIDDGKTWFPGEATGLMAKSIENGLESATIPNIPAVKKSIKIKLRDFPLNEGLPISLGK